MNETELYEKIKKLEEENTELKEENTELKNKLKTYTAPTRS